MRVLIAFLFMFFAAVTWCAIATTVETGAVERFPLVFLGWTIYLTLALIVNPTGWLIVLAAIAVFVAVHVLPARRIRRRFARHMNHARRPEER